MPTGAWVSTLDTSNPTIAALVMAAQLRDTIYVPSIVRTVEDIIINGVGSSTASHNENVAIIATDSSDTSELRYALGGNGPLAGRRVEATVK